jgi:phage-related protein
MRWACTWTLMQCRSAKRSPDRAFSMAFVFSERVVVVHAFVKKTQKTPQDALEVARKRATEVTS